MDWASPANLESAERAANPPRVIAVELRHRVPSASLVDAAYYVAGQAVVGWLFGWMPHSVTLYPQPRYEPIGDILDATPIPEIPANYLKPYAQDVITRVAAGVASLALLHPEENMDSLCKRRQERDLDEMDELASACSRDDFSAAIDLLDEAEAYAGKLVQRHADNIRWLAEALLKSQELHGDAVVEAMCDPRAVKAGKLRLQLDALEQQQGKASYQTEPVDL